MSQQVHATWNSPMPVDPTAKKKAMAWTAIIVLAPTLPLAVFEPHYAFLFPLIWTAPVIWPVGVWYERRVARKALIVELWQTFDASDEAAMPAKLDVFKGLWYLGSDAGVVTFGDGHELAFHGLRCDFDLIRQDIEPDGDRSYVVMAAHFKSTDLSFNLRPLSIPNSDEYPSRSDKFDRRMKSFLRSGKKRESPSLLPPNKPFTLSEMEFSVPHMGIFFVFPAANLVRLIAFPRESDVGFVATTVLYLIGLGAVYIYQRRLRKREVEKLGLPPERAGA